MQPHFILAAQKCAPGTAAHCRSQGVFVLALTNLWEATSGKRLPSHRRRRSSFLMKPSSGQTIKYEAPPVVRVNRTLLVRIHNLFELDSHEKTVATQPIGSQAARWPSRPSIIPFQASSGKAILAFRELPKRSLQTYVHRGVIRLQLCILTPSSS